MFLEIIRVCDKSIKLFFYPHKIYMKIFMTDQMNLIIPKNYNLNNNSWRLRIYIY